MGAADTAIDFLQFLDVLATNVSSKTSRIMAQVGSVVGRTVDGVNAEWWQHIGLASRPSKPVGGKSAARAVVIRRGNVDAAIASEDDRGLALLGLMKEGETTLYAAGEDGTAQGRVAIKQDGSINNYTTHDNTDQGRSVYSRTAPDGFAWVAPWGTVKFDPTGFHVNHASGASFDLGGISGIPAPLNAISSYAKLQAGVISQQAAMQTNGVGGGAALASAEAVISALTALQVEVAAVAAALVAVTNIPGVLVPGGPHSIAAEAGTVAVGVAAVALGTAETLIPTTTTSS